MNFKVLFMDNRNIQEELSSIRNLMERSSKFISLSGMSGVLAGIYALVGAYAGYRIVYPNIFTLSYRNHYVNESEVMLKLVLVAIAVLTASIATGIWFSMKKAKRHHQQIWNLSSQNLLVSMSVPLLTGGAFIIIMLFKGFFILVAPACLLFYGLSLVAGSHYTFKDVKWLGISEIALGLLAAAFPGYGLIFWALGFGILHIVYGAVMHFKYDR